MSQTPPHPNPGAAKRQVETLVMKGLQRAHSWPEVTRGPEGAPGLNRRRGQSTEQGQALSLRDPGHQVTDVCLRLDTGGAPGLLLTVRAESWAQR